MEDFWIPRNLDASPLLFIWEADIAFVHMAWIVLGGVLNMLAVGLVFSIMVGRAYARLKEEGGPGLLLKILYWYTPSEWWLSKDLPSNIREYIGG